MAQGAPESGDQVRMAAVLALVSTALGLLALNFALDLRRASSSSVTVRSTAFPDDLGERGRAPDPPSASTERTPDDAPARRVTLEPATPSAAAPVSGPRFLGTVVEMHGAPVTGALVLVFDGHAALQDLDPPGTASRPAARATTDEAGRFAIAAAAPDERLPVAVVARGFQTRWRRQFPDVDAPFELRGTVTCCGQLIGPVEVTRGASIRALRRSWDGETYRVREANVLDESGTFVVDDAALGTTLELGVTLACGEGWLESIPIDAGQVRDGRLVHDIDVSAVTQLEGRVFDVVSRQPIAGAQIELGGRAEPVTSAFDGSFSFELRGRRGGPGSKPDARGTASAPGFLATAFNVSSDTPSVVTLWPCGRMYGTVLAPDGSRVEGARVEWRPESFELATSEDSLTWTDTEGHFALTCVGGLDAGWLDVRAPGLGRAVVFEAAPETPGGERELTLRLSGEDALLGRVVWMWQGRVLFSESTPPTRGFRGPCGAADLEVTLARGTEADSELRTRTDAAGGFVFAALGDGPWNLSVRGPGIAARAPLHVASPEPAHAPPLRVFVELPRTSVHGRLMRADRSPVANRTFGFGPLPSRTTERATTDATGRFQIDAAWLPGGEPWLRVEVDGREVLRALSVTAGATVVLD